MRTMRQRSHRHATAAFAVSAVLLVAACGGSDDESSADDADSDTLATASPVSEETVAPDSSPTTEPVPETVVVELDEPDWDGLEPVELQAMGGLRLGVDPEWSVYHDNYLAAIRPGFEMDRGRTLPTVIATMIYNDRDLEPPTIESVLDVGATGEAEASGRQLELFGQTFDGYSFRIAEGIRPSPHYLYPAVGPVMVTFTAWQPFPLGEIFLAEIPGGVAAVGYVGADEAELAIAEELFFDVVPTFELLDGWPTERPTELVAFNPEGGDQVMLMLSPSQELAPANRDSFAPVEPGSHQFLGIGTPIELEFGDGWDLQLNDPAMLIFTGTDSFGPNDRSVDFRNGMTELVPTTVGPEKVGDPYDFADVDAFLAAPPPTLEVSGVGEVDLNGTSATVFDARISDDAACTADDPCHFTATSQFRGVVPVEFHRGISYRVWRIDSVEEPITIVASAPESTWLERADELVSTLVVESSSSDAAGAGDGGG